MDEKASYKLWCKKVDNLELKEELLKIKDSPQEIKDRFYKFIDFGTAGLRGIMGAGTNRINLYTIRKVTQGFAEYLKSRHQNSSVAISYDSRNNSREFAICASEVLAGNGIKVYLTDELQPTPYLSFCIRHLNCSAGIMITASHNTAEYNGYKCYGKDGAQITEKNASEIYNYISNIDIFDQIKRINILEGRKKGLIISVNQETYEEYLKCILNQRMSDLDFSDLRVVYTPLNGCGFKPICDLFKRIGLKNLKVVSEQAYPDGDFKTCPNPNPELLQAFDLAIRDAKEFGADLIIATDPDADRAGVCILDGKDYLLLSGNQLGVILFYYILESRNKKSYKNSVIIKTIVSSKLANAIAEDKGVEVIEVLTGFKNIASKILELESKNELSRFIFGFEESNGYLIGSYTRDKDAISAALLICEAAVYFKKRCLSFKDVLKELSEKYGYFGENTVSLEYKGYEGKLKIENIMTKLRKFFPKQINKLEVISVVDYLNDNSDFGVRANIISLKLESGEIIIRPSGTEPKIKAYIMLKANSKEVLEISLCEIKREVENLMKSLSN